jgi:deoxyinosine 3'endonuclease (endonuclease V)
MIACLDVDYQTDKAQAACLLFENWTDAQAFKTYTTVVSPIAEYIPGEFYKRELPCLLAVLNLITEPLELIVIDGYVWLDGENKKGLGGRLYDALDGKIPVAGVAKTNFKGAYETEQVFRGESKNPLFVSAIGTDYKKIARQVEQMAGEYRIPTLLKQVDSLCRNWT